MSPLLKAVILAAALLALAGCVVAPAPGPYAYAPGYSYAPGYYYGPPAIGAVDVGIGCCGYGYRHGR